MKENLAEVIILHDSNLISVYGAEKLTKCYFDFFSSLEKADKTVHVTLLLFGGEERVVFENQALSDIKLGDFGTASGACPLYDSLIKTIYKAGVRFAWTPEEERPSNVIFASVCFGKENASTTNTIHDVHKTTKHQADNYNWKFFHCTEETELEETFPHVDFITTDEEDFLETALGELSEKIITHISKIEVGV